jgi:NAD(P)H-dependent flavin oxidoreductase YrpB (nitropropane dioxygenase family)
MTRPIRTAAAAAGDMDDLHLWAGTNWQSVAEEPAADLVHRLAHELATARVK